MIFQVAIEDVNGGITTGEINSDTLDGQHADDFIGERMTIHAHDENGNEIEAYGVLVDVLDEREF